jgi:hypothetical protein
MRSAGAGGQHQRMSLMGSKEITAGGEWIPQQQERLALRIAEEWVRSWSHEQAPQEPPGPRRPGRSPSQRRRALPP